MKTVLVLGAGLVARPLVHYLLDLPDVKVIVASRTVSKAEVLIGDRPRGEARGLNVEDRLTLRRLIPEADLAISMLPYTYHPVVAELCVEFGKDMVTTSYVSPAMRALDERAKAARITVLNEIGVDPGIDHMSAMRVIHRVQQNGGEITSFRSWCGGFPAPEANTNPLGYKISWTPRGMLLAGRNAAHYLEDGKEINIPGEELFDHFWPVTIPGLAPYEGYPNRDAVPYAGVYGIPSARTVFRGTLRYPGWCATLKKIVDLGLLDLQERELKGLSCKQFLGKLIGYGGTAIREATAKHLGLAEDSFILDNLEWLGFFSDDPLPIEKGAPIDVLASRMTEKMRYGEGERDMLVLHHEFIAEYPSRHEAITSTMIDYGIPGSDSSMSRTVGLPPAIGTRLILEGKITRKGVVVPVTPDIYEPVLAELEQLGISVAEATHKL